MKYYPSMVYSKHLAVAVYKTGFKQKLWYVYADLIALMYFSSPVANPTLNPVAENILPALVTHTVFYFNFGWVMHLGYENG